MPIHVSDISMTFLNQNSPEAFYQDTLVSMPFSANLTFSGPYVAPSADGTSHIGFKMFLSDALVGGNELTEPSPLAVLDASSVATLSGELVHGRSYEASGTVQLQVPSGLCQNSDRFMCNKYVFMSDLHPSFREGNIINDYKCVNISAHLVCSGGMFTLLTFICLNKLINCE